MTGMLRVPRSRGALSGLLLILLGAWGALIPFIGPYFHYAYTPDTAWTYNTGRLWLEILPGAGAFLGGFIVLTAGTRPAALFGGWLAAMSGAWFVVGKPLSALWTAGGTGGTPVGGSHMQTFEQIGFFVGLGAAIVFFAALALGRFTVIGAREAALAAERAAAAEPAPVTEAEPATAPRRMVPSDASTLHDTPAATAAPVSTDSVSADSVSADEDEPRAPRHAMPWSRSGN
jgi:hypothetical protein